MPRRSSGRALLGTAYLPDLRSATMKSDAQPARWSVVANQWPPNAARPEIAAVRFTIRGPIAAAITDRIAGEWQWHPPNVPNASNLFLEKPVLAVCCNQD